MAFWKSRTEQLAAKIAENLVQKGMAEVDDKLRQLGEIVDLRREVERLKKAADEQKETMARETREIEHKLGLARKQQEFEAQKAKDEAVLEARKENLKAQEDLAKREIEIIRSSLNDHMESQAAILKQVMDRLPNITAELKVKRGQ